MLAQKRWTSVSKRFFLFTLLSGLKISLLFFWSMALFGFRACLRGILPLSSAASKDHSSSPTFVCKYDDLFIGLFSQVCLVMSFQIIAYSMSRGYLFISIFIFYLFNLLIAVCCLVFVYVHMQ